MQPFSPLGRQNTQVVGGVPYYVHPQVLGTVDESLSQDILPITVIEAIDSIKGSDDILELLKRFRATDDEYTEQFGDNLVLQVPVGQQHQTLVPTLQASPYFKKVLRALQTSHGNLPSGPYFLSKNGIHQAWRLYEDDLDAFIIPTIPSNVTLVDEFSPLNSLAPNGVYKHVAVPSRLYFAPSITKPLAGARVSIKDCYRLKGVKTTMMSLAYTQLYGPEDHSADYVQKLISLGAVIVGKTKMTAFASADEPTDMWVDYHCPLNPRGDRYQSPSGSSTGAASSLAGYGWLDYSIGADTGGSARAPATSNELFSLRPSFNTTSMRGIQANSPRFDTVGLFSRSISDLYDIVSNTLELKDSQAFPKKILYPTDFFPHSDSNQQAIVEEFISILENFLGVERTDFNLEDCWAKCPPAAAEGKPLRAYMEKSAFWPMCFEYFHEFDQFRQDYRAKFGANPYAGPVATFRWGIGKTVTGKERAQGWAELDVFRNWFETIIMAASSELLSDAIMIMPYGMGKPKYRDSPNDPPTSFHSISEKFMSPILEAPQLVFPIGQNRYISKFSGQTEFRPITTTLIGAKGSDLLLINLARAVLESASWPTEVLTGRYMFKPGTNTRSVAGDHMEHVAKVKKSVVEMSHLTT